jgi:hypothetical protein
MKRLSTGVVGLAIGIVMAGILSVSGNLPIRASSSAQDQGHRWRLHITNDSLPGATQGVAYSVQLTAFGGTQPYTWAVTQGSLPPGLTLSTTGVLSGTPTSPGTFNFNITVTDSGGAQASMKVRSSINKT